MYTIFALSSLKYNSALQSWCNPFLSGVVILFCLTCMIHFLYPQTRASFPYRSALHEQMLKVAPVLSYNSSRNNFVFSTVWTSARPIISICTSPFSSSSLNTFMFWNAYLWFSGSMLRANPWLYCCLSMVLVQLIFCFINCK